jgi:hypothetical protein
VSPQEKPSDETGMLTPHEATLLRSLLSRESAGAAAAGELRPGDLVQLRPQACRTFGGMLAVVCHAAPQELRGFLLRPHRGGCREAWLRWHHGDVELIGRTQRPQPEFARRCEARGPNCNHSR